MEEIQEKERELTDLRTANQKLMVQLKQAEDKGESPFHFIYCCFIYV